MHILGRSFLAFIAACSTLCVADENPFGEHEVRVIRPRYMNKAGRLELGLDGLSIMNQSYLYTFMGVAGLAFHATESWGFELAAAWGDSLERDSTALLDENFGLKPEVLHPRDMLRADVLWTPAYGKYQFGSGDVIYFDSFLSAGASSIGIEQDYRHCRSGLGLSNRTHHYPGVQAGLGQRYFLSPASSLRWSLRYHWYRYDQADSSCSPDEAAEDLVPRDHIALQLGFSYFVF